MANDVDYYNVVVPGDKKPLNYHWTERRAEILQMALKAGTFQNINQTKLAQRYDCSQGQISQDIDRLKEYIGENQGKELNIISELGFRAALNNMMEEGDYRGAIKAISKLNSWAEDRGIQEKEPEKKEIELTSTPIVEALNELEEEAEEEEQ
ncbi:MAG: hypothetical protein ABEJ07_01795 [Candidatus Nanohaloarchaea archaeon]